MAFNWISSIISVVFTDRTRDRCLVDRKRRDVSLETAPETEKKRHVSQRASSYDFPTTPNPWKYPRVNFRILCTVSPFTFLPSLCILVNIFVQSPSPRYRVFVERIQFVVVFRNSS